VSDSAGISGSTITNTIGNGNTVYDDTSSNASLNGATNRLVNGGALTPR
jgi:hypothetical protein